MNKGNCWDRVLAGGGELSKGGSVEARRAGSAEESSRPSDFLRREVDQLRRRCAEIDRRQALLVEANAQLLDLLLGFSTGVIEIRASMLEANLTAES